MPNKIVFVNPAEKTGKTSILREMAVYLSESYKILLIDLDPKMELSNIFLEKNDSIDMIEDLYYAITKDSATAIKKIERNIDIICGSRNMGLLELELRGQENAELIFKNFLDNIKKINSYDLVLIDTAFSEDLILSNALAASDFIFFVADQKNVGERNIESKLRISVEIKNNFNPDLKILGAVINEINPDMNFNSIKKEYKKIFYTNLFDSTLAEYSCFKIASRDNKFLRDLDSKDVQSALDEIKKITDEFLRRLRSF